jgi:hypothetical protein
MHGQDQSTTNRERHKEELDEKTPPLKEPSSLEGSRITLREP